MVFLGPAAKRSPNRSLTHNSPTLQRVVIRVHIDPGEIRRPGRPQAGVERRASRYRRPPLSRAGKLSSNVGLAVAVEVADLDIGPGDVGAPTAARAGVEGA